jgi:sterol desaturase/sphingolipid hydroxylase (fatty acid hydroxylase superfamily)
MYLSRASFFADFYVYPALAVILVAFALYRAPNRWAGATLAFLIGLGGWTFIEYIMHRYVLHHLTYIKDQHAKHHDDQKALFGTPTWLSLLVMLVLATGPAITYAGLEMGCAFTAGLMLGYLGYTLAHYTIHHWNARPGSYLFRLKQRHALHHHFDDMGNFGVSNGIWDYVFGTNIVVRRDESTAAEVH